MKEHDCSRTTVGEVTAEQWQEEMCLASLEERIATLFEALAHGSDEHRAWLKQAIDNHFSGIPVEAPRG